ncbi:hypothetical protein Xoosp13_94 [Xanthomonas phage Xoo-sp13]|nr:hypothetical protein Xoosp13_94 [Xanthomonas phage Xoo-sp13]
MQLDSIVKLKAKDRDKFVDEVYGGWSLADQLPEIFTTGVEVVKYKNGNYYLINEHGKPLDKVHSFEASTCFFTQEEVDSCMQFV